MYQSMYWVYWVSILKVLIVSKIVSLPLCSKGANLYFKLFVNPGAPLRIDKKVLNILDDCNPLWSVCVSLSPRSVVFVEVSLARLDSLAQRFRAIATRIQRSQRSRQTDNEGTSPRRQAREEKAKTEGRSLKCRRANVSAASGPGPASKRRTLASFAQLLGT